MLACVWGAMAGVRAASLWGGTARGFPASKDGWDKQRDDWEAGDHGAMQVGLGNSPRVVQKLCHVKRVA